jgi:hypothetical protein
MCLGTLSITVRCSRMGRALTLRFAHHVIVGVRLRYLAKAESLVELKRTVVLQAGGKRHLLTQRTGSSNGVLQEARANATTLIARLDLNLANLYCSGLIKQLNHARADAINFYAEDSPAFPTLRTMPEVPTFIPPTPRRKE